MSHHVRPITLEKRQLVCYELIGIASFDPTVKMANNCGDNHPDDRYERIVLSNYSSPRFQNKTLVNAISTYTFRLVVTD